MGFNEIPRGGEYTPDGFTRATHADKTRYLIENGRDKFAFGASLLEPTYRLSLPVESLPKINDGRVLQHEAMVLHSLTERPSGNISTQSDGGVLFGMVHADSRPRVYSLFDGVGNNSWYLSKAFGNSTNIRAFETDMRLHTAAFHNTQQEDHAITLNKPDDMLTVLHIAKDKKLPVVAVYMDPPVLPYEPHEKLYLSMIDYKLTSWLDAACQASDVVGVHLPGNVLDLALEEAADKMDRNLIVHSHHIEGTPDQTDTKIAYFINGMGKQEPVKETYILPAGSTQWQLAA